MPRPRKAPSPPPSKRDQARLETMNNHLYPVHLAYRADTGSYRIEYHREGHAMRHSLGPDLELAYERALQIRRQIDGSAAAIPIISSRHITLRQWYERYKADHISTLAIKSQASYELCWRHLEPIQEVPLHKLTRELIGQALEAITEKPSSKKKKIGPADPQSMKSTRGHVGVFLSVLLRAAVKANLLDVSPWTHSLQREKRAVQMLTREQLASIFKEATESARPMLALAGFLGLRREEIFGLKPRDINFEARLITIERTRIHSVGVGVVEQPRTKSGAPRVLPFTDEVAAYLAPALVGVGDDDYIFTNLRHDLPKRLRAAAKRAGIKSDLTLHDLRHVCGSNLMMSGGLAVAQAVLGHRDISTTANIYGHLTAAHLSQHLGGAATEKKREDWVDPVLLSEALSLASHLERNSDENVSRLASLSLQILSVFVRETKKDLPPKL